MSKCRCSNPDGHSAMCLEEQLAAANAATAAAEAGIACWQEVADDLTERLRLEGQQVAAQAAQIEALKQAGDRLAGTVDTLLSILPFSAPSSAVQHVKDWGALLAPAAEPAKPPFDLHGLPTATDATICPRCGESGHWWCQPSRIRFTGRGVPNVYPTDFDDGEAAEPVAAEGGAGAG